jgi:hypothetical protein
METREKRIIIWDRNFEGKILRRATENDYIAWLVGYIRNGGRPTHYYDYKMPLDNFYVAQEDFIMIPLYGSLSINVIVPENVNFLGGELGHCNIYLMKDFKTLGGWIPVYRGFYEKITDSEVRKILKEFIEEKKEEERRWKLEIELEEERTFDQINLAHKNFESNYYALQQRILREVQSAETNNAQMKKEEDTKEQSQHKLGEEHKENLEKNGILNTIKKFFRLSSDQKESQKNEKE